MGEKDITKKRSSNTKKLETNLAGPCRYLVYVRNKAFPSRFATAGRNILLRCTKSWVHHFWKQY